MQQNKQSSVYSKNRRKRRRQKIVRRILVLSVLVLILLLTALLLPRLMKEPVPEDTPSSSFASSVSSSVASSFSVKSSAPSSAPELPKATGQYDEKNLPMLVNASYLIPDEYEPSPVDVGNGHSMDKRAAAAFSAMSAAASKDGTRLLPISGYRSHEHQLKNYNNSIQRYVNQGKTKANAVSLTQEYYAIPGTSEHEAGLAMDIESLEETFENTKTFTWLQENCAKHGFILRYPKDKQTVTGIAYEPWHYRYVGVNHALAMKELKITTLEEYWEYFKEKPDSAAPDSGTSGSSGGSSSSNSGNIASSSGSIASSGSGSSARISSGGSGGSSISSGSSRTSSSSAR